MGVKRVKINGDWYDANGWMGATDLTKYGSPTKYTTKEPFAHITGLYHVFDANNNKVGEFHIGNRTYSGRVTDFEA